MHNEICIGFVIVILLWLFISWHSVTVYRFYRPQCPHCVNSQGEWNKFQRKCWFKPIKVVNVNLNDQNKKNKKLIKSFNVKSVPTVTLITDAGVKAQYNKKRNSDAYLDWVSSFNA
jgi:thiol-disulfide isomerase/thioredoxin